MGPQRVRFASLPHVQALAAGDRPGAYMRATWGTFVELARAIDPSRCRNLARTMAAHTAIETGWGAGLWCWNVGNVMARGEEAWFPMDDSAIVVGPDGTPINKAFAARFAFFRTLRAGTIHYLRTIARIGGGRAIELASEGSPAFFPLLRAAGYFGGYATVHPGEKVARADSDAELASKFAGILGRVDAELEPIDRRARLVGAGVMTACVGGLGALVLSAILD